MKLPPSPAARSQMQAWLTFSRTAPARAAAVEPTRGVRLVYGIRATVLRMLVALVLAVAALAFVASFETISAFAVAIGWPAGLRWVAPLLVDTFTLVGTLLVIWLGLTGRNPWGCVAGYYGRSLIMIGTAASMIVNLDAHRSTLLGPGADATVPDAAVGAAVLAVGPPAALFLAVEALVIVARYALTDLAAAAEQVGVTRPVTAATVNTRPAGSAHDPGDDRPAPVTLDRTDRPASATSSSIPVPGLPADHASLGGGHACRRRSRPAGTDRSGRRHAARATLTQWHRAQRAAAAGRSDHRPAEPGQRPRRDRPRPFGRGGRRGPPEWDGVDQPDPGRRRRLRAQHRGRVPPLPSPQGRGARPLNRRCLQRPPRPHRRDDRDHAG